MGCNVIVISNDHGGFRGVTDVRNYTHRTLENPLRIVWVVEKGKDEGEGQESPQMSSEDVIDPFWRLILGEF